MHGSFRIFTVFLLATCLCLPGVPAAQEKTPEIEALERFFTAETIEADWFAQVFLDQVPASQLMPVRQQVTAGLGAFQRAEADPSGQGYRAIFENGYIPSTISLDGEGKINGLFLRPPVNEVSSTQDAIDSLAALGGEVAVLVTRNDETLHDVNADVPLAVGSAFKLSILAALQGAVDSGERRWEDVYELTAADRSLPSGTLRTWPEGAPLTLYSLATRMIAESDNTATDALLRALGRGAVEAMAPARNRPFLSTREAFVLKNPDHAELADAYLAGNEDTRRQVLAQAAGLPVPSADVFSAGGTVRPEIEWFYSARELCAVMEAVAAHPITQVNDAGIASPDHWASVSYKGGSEPGVLNQTFWLRDKAGNDYCVTATRNDNRPFDNTPLFTAVNGLISALSREFPATP